MYTRYVSRSSSLHLASFLSGMMKTTMNTQSAGLRLQPGCLSTRPLQGSIYLDISHGIMAMRAAGRCDARLTADVCTCAEPSGGDSRRCDRSEGAVGDGRGGQSPDREPPAEPVSRPGSFDGDSISLSGRIWLLLAPSWYRRQDGVMLNALFAWQPSTGNHLTS